MHRLHANDAAFYKRLERLRTLVSERGPGTKPLGISKDNCTSACIAWLNLVNF